MKNGTTKTIVEYAIICALLFCARSLDHVMSGWLPINSAAITLAVAYACMLYKPTFSRSLICGVLFGVMSLITSLMFGGGAVVYGMANPLVSVLPRAIVGVVVYFVFFAIARVTKTKKGFLLAVAIACIAGTVTNTATVVSMMWVFQSIIGKTLTDIIAIILSVNMVLEIIVPTIIVPFVVIGMRKGLKVKDAYTNKLDASKVDSESEKDDICSQSKTE